MTDEIASSNCCGIESNDWHLFNGVREGFCPDCKEHCSFETNNEAGPGHRVPVEYMPTNGSYPQAAGKSAKNLS